ncbi:MAG: MBL fold metallo-hydrolase [Pseudomonadota bacterium]
MLCRIGEVEIWRILEINAPFRSPEQLFPTAGPDVTALIEAHAPGTICMRTRKLILPVQGFLIRTAAHLILVDTCVGNHKTCPGFADWHHRDTDRFRDALKAAGAGWADVDYVLCTHLHVDHIGWNTQLQDGRWVPSFPKARYLLPAADRERLESQASQVYRESVLPVIEAGQAEWVDGAYQIGDCVHLIPTPGHTCGHVSVLVGSNGSEAIITGDALHTSAQCHFPDWHFVYDDDPERAAVSRRALLENATERDARVLGSHFRLPSLGRVRAAGDAFRWVPD